MTKKDVSAQPPESQNGGWQFASVASVDTRGQLILPKELRIKAGIQDGDRLALMYYEKDGETCCFTLMKAD